MRVKEVMEKKNGSGVIHKFDKKRSFIAPATPDPDPDNHEDLALKISATPADPVAVEEDCQVP